MFYGRPIAVFSFICRVVGGQFAGVQASETNLCPKKEGVVGGATEFRLR